MKHGGEAAVRRKHNYFGRGKLTLLYNEFAPTLSGLLPVPAFPELD